MKILCQDCDSGMADLPANSIDLIFTDPPYVKDLYREAYALLGTHAPRLLKPSGFLITYAPQYHLHEIMQILGKRLEWYWICMQINRRESILVHQKNAIAKHKPIVIYQKAPKKPNKRIFVDVIAGMKQKRYHPWEQSIHDALHLLSRFAAPGDVVLDPFMGSGTTILAGNLLGLECIAPILAEEANPRLDEAAKHADLAVKEYDIALARLLEAMERA
ncbi:MAG: DNA methyltransferase [bacterium]